MNPRLRIGLLLDSYFVPAWARTAIQRIIRSKCAELVLVVLNSSEANSRPDPEAFWRASRHGLYHLFNAIDEKLFLHGQNALAQTDTSRLFANVPSLAVKAIGRSDGLSFSTADIEKIRFHRLDILIKLGFGNLCGDIAAAAKYGVWTYRWGDPRKIEDGLPGFWEVVGNWSETGVAVEQLGSKPGDRQTLFESWFFTYPFSPARSRNYILWAAASFLPRLVERLSRLGEERFLQELKKSPRNEAQSALKSNNIPSNLVVAWLAVKLAARILLEGYRRTFCREQWMLLFNFEQNAATEISAFTRLSPPPDRFWADPHVIYKAPNYYIFVEEYLYRAKKGHISVIEMDQTGSYKPPVPILQKDYHLSFPFVFTWQGHEYMIPESSGQRTIDLYACIRFPDQWQWKTTLMRGIKAVDTVVLYARGKWWLFTAMSEQEQAAPQVELFLFYSNELFTDRWHAHPMNPIVSDVKRARAAGGIFTRDGKLFRPSQRCSPIYGYGFDLNEITVLTETDYCERTVTSVRPEQARRIIATHTYASQGNLTVIDALTRRYKGMKTG